MSAAESVVVWVAVLAADLVVELVVVSAVGLVAESAGYLVVELVVVSVALTKVTKT